MRLTDRLIATILIFGQLVVLCIVASTLPDPQRFFINMLVGIGSFYGIMALLMWVGSKRR